MEDEEGRRREGGSKEVDGDWEISVSSPNHLEVRKGHAWRQRKDMLTFEDIFPVIILDGHRPISVGGGTWRESAIDTSTPNGWRGSPGSKHNQVKERTDLWVWCYFDAIKGKTYSNHKHPIMISVIISMDDCWMINIKAPALLDVQTSEVDKEGFQVNLIFFAGCC